MISLRRSMSLRLYPDEGSPYSPPAFVRVSTARNPASSNRSHKSCAIIRFKSLSFTFVRTPTTPPSMPPCPASITTVKGAARDARLSAESGTQARSSRHRTSAKARTRLLFRNSILNHMHAAPRTCRKDKPLPRQQAGKTNCRPRTMPHSLPRERAKDKAPAPYPPAAQRHKHTPKGAPRECVRSAGAPAVSPTPKRRSA